jgi:hypothetical protein
MDFTVNTSSSSGGQALQADVPKSKDSARAMLESTIVHNLLMF